MSAKLQVLDAEGVTHREDSRPDFSGCSPLPFWIPEEKQMVEYFQPKM
jgi:hypothetical protein